MGNRGCSQSLMVPLWHFLLTRFPCSSMHPSHGLQSLRTNLLRCGLLHVWQGNLGHNTCSTISSSSSSSSLLTSVLSGLILTFFSSLPGSLLPSLTRISLKCHQLAEVLGWVLRGGCCGTFWNQPELAAWLLLTAAPAALLPAPQHRCLLKSTPHLHETHT